MCIRDRFYCARGEMENRIKEQMCLFADRLSTDEMKGNQLRLYFSALAYTLMEALRRLALKGTEWAQAQVDTCLLYTSQRSPSRSPDEPPNSPRVASKRPKGLMTRDDLHLA